jgi:Protein of unknown function (DUF4235)
VVSVLGGILAGAIFKRIWKAAAGEDEAPKATDAQFGWGEVLVAATLKGAIFAPPSVTARYPADLGHKRPVGPAPSPGL